ncbi:hypothetical protein [Streptomyces sp. NBC_00986]|uniref:hypothetical protein n=1 Tax=Streptomyces sp. NBC_00986 TaxID=2903702 RepID=UPI003864FB5A|nr:hypothetical protein OG504_08010 [Streptomyces sp. NBC_00986]
MTLPYNSGVAEGVTDRKMIKRQMAGRVGIRLLRKRVIFVAHSCRSNQLPSGQALWSINSYEDRV